MKELHTLIDGLFDQIEMKKVELRKKHFDAKERERLDLAENDASVMASIVTDLKNKVEQNPNEREKILSAFRKAVADIKTEIDSIN